MMTNQKMISNQIRPNCGMAALLFVLTICHGVSATEYHVATTGSDRNSGSQTQPFQTIARALAAARLPGDQVVVRKGTYQPSRTLNLINAGSREKWITLRAFKNEQVIIDGSQTPKGANLISVLNHHIRIQDLQIQNSHAVGIVAWGPGSRIHHVEVIGNIVERCQQGGIYAGFNNLSNPVRDIIFERNTIKNCVLSNEREPRTRWNFGLGAGLSKNVTIRNNVVSRCYGEGIGLYLSDQGIVEQNRISDNFSVNLYLDNTTHTRVDRNLVYSTHDDNFYRFNQPASGIQIANEYYPGRSNPSSHNVITNNLLINNFIAFHYGNYQQGGGLRQTIFANNTAWGATGPLLSINADNRHQDTRFINNIFQQVGGRKLTDIQGPTDQIEFRNNLWHGGVPHQSVNDVSDIDADPLFINAGSKNAKDYQLRKNSPARNAGIKTKEVSHDFAGTQRLNSIDLGAWQFDALAKRTSR